MKQHFDALRNSRVATREILRDLDKLDNALSTLDELSTELRVVLDNGSPVSEIFSPEDFGVYRDALKTASTITLLILNNLDPTTAIPTDTQGTSFKQELLK